MTRQDPAPSFLTRWTVWLTALILAGVALILLAGAIALSQETTSEDAVADATDARAHFQTASHSFAEALVADLSAIAGDETLDEDARQAAFRRTLGEALAAGPMGRFILGATARQSATPEQLARYEAAFPLYIAQEFSSQIDLLADQRIEVEQVIPRPQRFDEVIVQSQMYGASGRKAARVDWRVRNIEDAPRLVDVLVDRVSPLVTKREEVSSLVAREGIETLLVEMEALAAG